jgi:carbamoylphosphate synthase large subunit
MGSTAAQNLVHALRADSSRVWRIIGGDLQARHGGLGLADVDVELPDGTDASRYLECVKSCAKENGPQLFVPVMEPELRAASLHRAALEQQGLRVLLSDPACIEICASKRKLAEAFRDAGLDTPAPRTANGPYPVFARPDCGSGSRGATVITNRDAFEQLGRTDLAMTEVIEGSELSVDGFARSGGQIEQLIARTRDEVRLGLAVRSRVVAVPDELLPGLEKLCARLGVDGFFNVQFRIVAGRGPVFFDFNPRLGGAMNLSFAAGLQAAKLLLAWLGEAAWPGPAAPRIGMELYRRWHSVIIDAP